MTSTQENHLRDARKAAGVTQKALARAVGVSTRCIRAVERGEARGLLLALNIGAVLDQATDR